MLTFALAASTAFTPLIYSHASSTVPSRTVSGISMVFDSQQPNTRRAALLGGAAAASFMLPGLASADISVSE